MGRVRVAELPDGLTGASIGSPPRLADSVRRTSSLDLTRPEGPQGGLFITGRARDLHTAADGTATVVGNALMSAVVRDGVVSQLSFHPDGDRAAELVGRKAGAGFRTSLWRIMRDHYDAGSGLHLLLDELPVAMIIAGFTYRRSSPPGMSDAGRRPDVCAGWSQGGRAMRHVRDGGAPPVPVTPPAPSLVRPDDPAGWHTLPGLPKWGLSRRRRIDVARGNGHIQVEAMFRDSFVDADNVEKVLHEYAVDARLEPDQGAVHGLAAEPRVLPHLECPLSAGSTGRVVGARATRFREVVSMELFGPSSCTHLNDLLRSLSDAPALGRHLQ